MAIRTGEATAPRPRPSAEVQQHQPQAEVQRQRTPQGASQAGNVTPPTDQVVRADAPLTGDDRITALEQRVAAQEREIQRMRDDAARAEEEAAAKARKPGFFRALLEIFEFIGRWFSPFFNMISLIFRVARITWKLVRAGFDFKRAGINWKDELVRGLGDLAGIFFPPAGAIVNSGMNILDPFGTQPSGMGRSQMLGGVNEFFDGGVVKENPFRRGFHSVVGGAKDAFNGARGIFGGGEAEGPSGEVDYRAQPATVYGV